MEKEKQRMLELLADRTLFGLTEEETAELENLKKIFSEFENDNSFEMAAAQINLINLEMDDSLPPHLQTKLAAQAEKVFGITPEAREFSSFENNQAAELPQDVFARSIDEFAPKSSIWNWKWLGLAATATACIALAISLWLASSQPKPEIADEPKVVQTPESVKSPELAQIPESVKTPEPVGSPESVKTPEVEKTPESAQIPKTVITPENFKTPESAKNPDSVKIPAPAKTPTPELSAVQRREQLLASAPDVVQTNWTAAKGDKRVLGDVVWSNAQQKGYIRLRDLPALDASRETYQLWIFDDKTPVSGGIFNVGKTGEVIIPINAQSKIKNPKQFAVSKEKAGGVVVTKPERIVAVAKI